MKAPWARWSGAAIAVVWGATSAYYANLSLPPGMHLSSPARATPTQAVSFLADVTGANAYGNGFSTHTIFEAMLHDIGAARQLVVLDCHLCTDLHRTSSEEEAGLTPLGTQLLDALLARKAAVPALQVLLIADPINGLYGTAPPPQFAALRAAGIQVVTADLARLRDRNVLYSGLWRLLLGWWRAPAPGGGWLPDPFSDAGPPLTARAWADLANLKSSDRRVLIADDGQGALTALVGTAEPAMAASLDTVTALQVRGSVVQPLLNSELELARAFGWHGVLDGPGGEPAATDPPGGDAGLVQLQWLGEGALRDAVLRHINAAGDGDDIDIATDTLSERSVIAALLAASRRGASVRLILDPQKTASLWRSPNQSVGSELLAASDGRIHVAWYRTQTERFRAGLVLVRGAGPAWLALGSASLTRRDLDDYDLALDVGLTGAPTAAPVAAVREFFDRLWNDRGPPGIEFTADADTWADPSQLRYWTYRVMEQLGISRS